MNQASGRLVGPSGPPTYVGAAVGAAEAATMTTTTTTTTRATSFRSGLSALPPRICRNGGSRDRSSHQRGFMLLEAIVALVIFSLVAVSLYAWQSTNVQAIQRAEAHARSNAATRSALAVIADVNPMLTPKGERPMGTDTVRWTSTPVQPKRDGVTAVGLPSLFDLGLYELHVQVLDRDTVIAAFDVRQAGYKQVRQMDMP